MTITVEDAGERFVICSYHDICSDVCSQYGIDSIALSHNFTERSPVFVFLQDVISLVASFILSIYRRVVAVGYVQRCRFIIAYEGVTSLSVER